MSSGANSTDHRKLLLAELKRIAQSDSYASANSQESDHPSNNELYDYVSCQLPKDRLPGLMKHISRCSECNKEVWRIRSFVEESESASLAWSDSAQTPKEEDKTNVIPFSRKSDSQPKRDFMKWGLSLVAAIALVALGIKLFNYETFFEKPTDRIAATAPSPSHQLMGPTGDSESDSSISLDLRLLEAASKGDQSSVESLLNSGADINAVDSQKRTSLSLAASNGHRMVVLILLKRGADASIKDNHGDMAVDLALKNGHESVASVLRPATPQLNR
ncbi:MAG: ankyrin repeat domain-containing protein [Desulfomonilaceae bacterium]